MSPAHEPSQSAPAPSSPQLERLLNAFEDAWDQGPPSIDAFLPSAETDRRAALVELAHIDLERRLKAGKSARVEDYFQRYPALADERRVALDFIAAEYRLRRRQEPELTPAEYLQRFPHFAGDLTARLQDPSERTALYETHTPAEQTASTVDGTARPSTQPGAPAGKLADLPLPQIPGYEILEVLGRGGMGLVLKARHEVLGRPTAIKVPLAHQLTDDESRERFVREARSAARLRHPHICPIYEVGQAEGLPFIVMGFIQGETLRDHARRQRPSPRDAAAVVALLARAVGYAHERGVVHRDIKPANVMLDAETGQPILMDFGLAKELSDDVSQLTCSGQIMGTPAYMAPEQAAGRLDLIGPAADVYALGAVLYELLCGRPPFTGGPAEVLHKVQAEEPTPPGKLVPRLHRDLETVCLKALAKEPAARYASAVALAEDLERFSAGEAILARREGVAARLWRKARRHPLTAASAVVLLLAAGLAVFLVGHYLDRRQVEEGMDRVRAELKSVGGTAVSVARAEAALAKLAAASPEEAAFLRRKLHERLKEIAQGLLGSDILRDEHKERIRTCLDLLAARAPELERPLRQRWEQRVTGFDKVFHLKGDSSDADLDEVFPGRPLRRQADGLMVTLPDGADAKGTRVVSLNTRVPCQGNVKFQAVLEGAVPHVALTLHAGGGHHGIVSSASFAPDGRVLATAGADGTVRLWDVVGGEERAVLQAHKPSALAVRFAPDGKTLASGGADGKVRIWDARSGKQLAALDACTAQVWALAYSPDGEALASGGTPRQGATLQVWDVATRRERFKAPAHEDMVRSLAFSPDGKLLASGSQDGQVKLWDWRAGQETATLDAGGGLLFTVAFAPDGRTLATASSSGKVRLWDVATRRVRAVLEAYSAGAFGLSFAPDGRTLAVGHDMGQVQLWDLATEQIRATFAGHTRRVEVVQFSPDGWTLATTAADGGARLWDVDTERPRLSLIGRGYDFLLEAPKRPAGGKNSAAPAGGLYRLAIQRNGMGQRAQTVPVKGGELRLTVQRAGDRLSFQVNELPPVVFRDVLPGGPRGGVFALRLPPGVRLVSLQAFRQPAPAVQNTLERGDEQFARQRYAKALEHYDAQLRAGGADAEALREARCKAALCLAALHQPEDAARLFETVIAEGGRPEEVWRLVATFQLWLLRLEQQRYGDAEKLFLETGSRRFEEVAAVIPEEVRGRILRAYDRLARPTTFLFFDPRVLAPMRRAVEVADYFQAPAEQRARLRHLLVWAYHLGGQRESAARTADEALRLLGAQAADVLGLAEYVWLTRLAYDPERALGEVSARLEEARAGRGGGPVPTLLLARARLHAALGKAEQAGQDVEELLRLPDGKSSYDLWCAGHLLHGFLRERAGDRAGALAIWERGRWAAWPGRLLASAGTSELPDTGIPVLYNLMLGSLTGQITDAEAKATLARLAAGVGRGSPHLGLLQMAGVQTGVFRAMGQTRRGRALIGKVALGEVSRPELLRTPILLLIAEFFHQSALPGPVPADQEDVIWQAVEASLDAYARGELKMEHLNHLGAAWAARGELFGMGWRPVKDALAPALRGPLAYLLGHRYLARGKRAEAVAFFETALRDAPAGSALQRLSRAELDRLKTN